MSPSTDVRGILGTIDRVIESRPFRTDVVAGIFDSSLNESAASNSYYRVEVGRGSVPFAGIEVREPQTPAGDRGGIVILTLEDVCLTEADVGDHFGPSAGIADIPHPEAPPDLPLYRTHPQAWGEARLGYTPSTGCLRSVVLDATGT